MIYREGREGPYYMKRFSVTGVTRNTDYPLASDKKGSERYISQPILMEKQKR
jgi:topoisomerase-4 subunit A